jgi:hypothetical protein
VRNISYTAEFEMEKRYPEARGYTKYTPGALRGRQGPAFAPQRGVGRNRVRPRGEASPLMIGYLA